MSIRASTRALLLSTALGAAAAQGATPYDGFWALEITTEKGPCEPLYRYYLVVDGKVIRLRSFMGETAYSSAGFVQPNGLIDVRVGQAADPLTIRGRLGAKAGQGTWTATARGCHGNWRAAGRPA
jgi:hypothetical protein